MRSVNSAHQRIAQARHVEQELRAAIRAERVQVGDHRVGQQQQIARYELLLPTPPIRRHGAEHRGGRPACIVHAAVNRGFVDPYYVVTWILPMKIVAWACS
jgi:hypothetical protein